MAKSNITFKEELSKKKNALGKSEILVRVTLTRDDKPRFKTGVFIDPDESLSNLDTNSDYSNFQKSLIRIVKEGHRLIEEGYFEGSINKEFIENVFEMYNNGKLYKSGTVNECVKDLKLVEYLDIDKSLKAQTREQEAQKRIESLSQRKTLYQYVDIYCQVNNISEQRTKSYHVLERMLARFEQYQRIVKHLDFVWDYDTMTKDDVISFEKYLKEEHSLEMAHPKEYIKIKTVVDQEHPIKNRRIATDISDRSNNHIVGVMSKFRAIMNYLFDNGITNNRPFIGVVKGKEKYGVPYFLTIEERNKIFDLDLSSNPSLEAQRDIFVFQSLTGCRVGDLVKLTPKNIVNGVLIYEPSKTSSHKEPIVPRVPLTQKALSIVAKYKDSKIKGNKLFPFISPQKYNEAIKKIIELAKIDRCVAWFNPRTNREEMRPLSEVASSHMARRTFVGNAYKLTKDVDVISSMSGHVQGSKAFDRYRNIDDDDRKELIDLID